MNNKKYLIAIFLMFSSIANAQNYKINIVLDNNSNKYINSIKNEAQALFSSVDKIDYNLIVCVNDCYKYINNSDKKLVILNDNKKYIQNKNSYIISYNQILNSYDENQLLRASALGIFEFLKENKISNSVYIENKKIESFESFKELKENSNIKKLDLKDIYTFIKNNQKITKDEAINIVETILIKANKENVKLNQKELDIFFKSIKLLELNSKPTTVLTYLLLSILEKEAK